MKLYLTTPEGYTELTNLYTIHKITGLSTLDIFNRLIDCLKFKYDDYIISKTNKTNAGKIYTATHEGQEFVGNALSLSKKIGFTSNSIIKACTEKRLLGDKWKITSKSKNVIKCVWNGDKMYHNISCYDFKALINRNSFSLLSDYGYVNGWIYDVKDIITSPTAKKYCNYYAEGNGRYYFNTATKLKEKFNVPLCMETFKNELYQKGEYKINNITIRRG